MDDYRKHWGKDVCNVHDDLCEKDEHGQNTDHNVPVGDADSN